MVLVPDLSTYRVEPFPSSGSRGHDQGYVARLICDVHNPDGAPFEGCPRLTLKRQCEAAAELGYRMMAGPEAEVLPVRQGRWRTDHRDPRWCRLLRPGPDRLG